MSLEDYASPNPAIRKSQSDAASRFGVAARDAVGTAIADPIDKYANDAGNFYDKVMTPIGHGIRSFFTGDSSLPATPPATTAAATPAVTIPKTTASGTYETPTQYGTSDSDGNTTLTDKSPSAAYFTPPAASVAPQFQASRFQPADNSAALDRIQQLQKPITSIEANNFQDANTPLGGFMSALLALGGLNKLNQNRVSELKAVTGEDQRETKNAMDAYSTNAKTAQEAFSSNVGAQKSTADADFVKAKTAQENLDTQNKVQIDQLRQKIVKETDPKKRMLLQNQLYALVGKPQSKYQIVTQKSTDANNMPVETPYIVQEDEAGNPISTPVVKPKNIDTDPMAIAIRDDAKMSAEQKKAELKKLGY